MGDLADDLDEKYKAFWENGEAVHVDYVHMYYKEKVHGILIESLSSDTAVGINADGNDIQLSIIEFVDSEHVEEKKTLRFSEEHHGDRIREILDRAKKDPAKIIASELIQDDGDADVDMGDEENGEEDALGYFG